MNWDLILVVIFGLVLLLIMRLKKKNTETQKILFPLFYLILYKTKWGLKFMDRISKKNPKFWHFLEYVSIVFGFAGMIFIFGFLIKGIYDFLFLKQPSPIQLLLPGVKVIPGLPTMSFWHWIVAIFILATVHETCHGIFARLNNIKLKSSGFAIFGILLPIIPAAFVEPDEKQLMKAKTKTQLSVFSAGSFSNLVTALIAFLILSFLITPATSAIVEETGVMIIKIDGNLPINNSGITPGEKILTLNGINMNNVSEFVKVMKTTSSDQEIILITDKNTYTLTTSKNPDDPTKGYLGIYVSAYEQEFKQEYVSIYGEPLLKALFWVSILFFWLFVANFGVGLFNLLPLGPLDGGRMFLVSMIALTKNEKLSKKIFSILSIFILALIIIGLFPQFLKLISPLLNLF